MPLQITPWKTLFLINGGFLIWLTKVNFLLFPGASVISEANYPATRYVLFISAAPFSITRCSHFPFNIIWAVRLFYISMVLSSHWCYSSDELKIIPTLLPSALFQKSNESGFARSLLSLLLSRQSSMDVNIRVQRKSFFVVNTMHLLQITWKDHSVDCVVKNNVQLILQILILNFCVFLSWLALCQQPPIPYSDISEKWSNRKINSPQKSIFYLW